MNSGLASKPILFLWHPFMMNGTVMQDANTANVAFGITHTIALLLEAMTLEPGDVILIGIPGGVGYARPPPVWIKPEDTTEIDIEGIGTLANEVMT